MYLQFRNPGLIDELVFKSFGVSVKDNANAIGYFGTGLKYAIAIILRHHGKILIVSGNKRYDFECQIRMVRNKPFEYVCCNDEVLSYTTDLGKKWKLWMAYRELYSNCKDENGELILANKVVEENNTTSIYVDCYEMMQIHKNDSEKVFLKGSPLYSVDHLDIYPERSNYLYYKGIRVGETASMSQYTYNITSPISLTEDRTISYSWEANGYVSKGICSNADPSFFKKVFSDFRSYEYSLDYTSYELSSTDFINCAIDAYKKDPNSIPPKLYDAIFKVNKEISNFVNSTLTNLEQRKLDKAIAFCKQIDFDPSPYKIIVVDTLGKAVLALADTERNEIILSKKLFDHGVKYLVSTIVEEVVHLKENYSDCTRSMQTYLFDKIVTLGEKYTGECL